MRENYTLTRLYVSEALSEDAEMSLTEKQVHYLANVLRKKEGDNIRVFNGRDGEWLANVFSLTKKYGDLRIFKQLHKSQRSPDITLCFAPIRKHRTQFIIEKSTELGVRALQPVITARTQFPKLNIQKARLQAIEAAEQTERLDLPIIEPLLKLDALLSNWNSERPLIFADEAGDALPALSALEPLSEPSAILIGPEGGFTPQEREMIRDHSFVRPVSLGPRILRADTAALSLLTLWQAVQGDWSQNKD